MSQGTQQERPSRYLANVGVELFDLRSHVVRTLALHDISVGGAFVCELTAIEPGAQFQLSIDGAVDFTAAVRAVHVRDHTLARQLHQPAGAGLQFFEMTPTARARLDGFITTLRNATGEPPVKPLLRARIPGAGQLELLLSGEALAALWTTELSKGRLLLEAFGGPQLRELTLLTLRAPHGSTAITVEVVHRVQIDNLSPVVLGLQVISADKGALERFMHGALTAHVHVPGAADITADALMARVRTFFTGLESGKPQLALGVASQEPAVLREEAMALHQLLAHPPEGLSAPQRARVDAALRAVGKLEQVLGERAPFIDGKIVRAPSDAPPSPLPAPASTVEVAPPAPPPRIADELVERAETFAVALMPAEAVYAAREAAKHPLDESQLTRVVGACMQVKDFGAAIDLAHRAVAVHPRNTKCWQVILEIYEQRRHYALALRAAQALLAIEPRDGRVKAQVARFRALALSNRSGAS